jgi:hypothetical protein
VFWSKRQADFVELMINEMIRISGTVDRLKSLQFLKEYWVAWEQDSELTWTKQAKQWALRGDSFLI